MESEDRSDLKHTAGLPPWIWPRAAYVHVPFCAHHCCYCDFAVAVGQDSLINRYIDALRIELGSLPERQRVSTLFLGGGTPTHLQPAQLARLLEAVLHWLPLSPGGEFSIEANPGTLTDDHVRVLAEMGVNRVSLGVQSFDRAVLRILERDHELEDVARAVEMIHKRIDRLSLDLIFGVPGQTLEQWQGDLKMALSLRPSHLSTYGLTYEKGTRLWKQRERKEIQPLGEDEELNMYLATMDTLAEAGWEHYEISSFALPGQRCRHNQVYWANEAYFGFGLGAARYVERRRELNTRNLATYVQKMETGQSPTIQSEMLPPIDLALETLAMQLRRDDGVKRQQFRIQTEFDLDQLVGSATTTHLQAGLLVDNGSSLRLTRQGKCVADALIQSLFRHHGSGLGPQPHGI